MCIRSLYLVKDFLTRSEAHKDIVRGVARCQGAPCTELGASDACACDVTCRRWVRSVEVGRLRSSRCPCYDGCDLWAGGWAASHGPESCFPPDLQWLYCCTALMVALLIEVSMCKVLAWWQWLKCFKEFIVLTVYPKMFGISSQGN